MLLRYRERWRLLCQGVFYVAFVLLIAGCGSTSTTSSPTQGLTGRVTVEYPPPLHPYPDFDASSTGASGFETRGATPRSRVGGFSSPEMSAPLSPEDINEWIISVGGISERELASQLAPFGVTLLRPVYGTSAYVVRVDSPGKNPAQVMDDVAFRIPEVWHVEPNLPVRAQGIPPNDPHFRDQWNLRQIGILDAWELLGEAHLGYQPVTIAIVDTAICKDHEDLQDFRWIDGISVIKDPLSPYRCPNIGDENDEASHGTHVASIIGAATDNGIGMAGAFWDPYGGREIELMAVEVLDSQEEGDLEGLISGINRALDRLNPPAIINLSLSVRSLNAYESSQLREAIQNALQAGILVVAAAGNDGRVVAYPAAYDDVIAVGSTDASGQRSSFSSTGPKLDLVAPGADIRVAWSPSGYGYNEGTSFSAPLVTAVAAMLMSTGVDDPELVRDILKFSARSITTSKGQTIYDKAQGHSVKYGWGFLDAAAALRLRNVPEIFLAEITPDKVYRKSRSVRPRPDGRFSLIPPDGEHQLFVVAWVDANGNGRVDTPDFFASKPISFHSSSPLNIGTLVARPYTDAWREVE